VTVVVVPGVPSSPIQLPYVGTIFQENKFEVREHHLFDWKFLHKASSYYNVVTSPDLWYFKAVSTSIHSLNVVTANVYDKDGKVVDDKGSSTSLVVLCAETISSEENEYYRDTTKKDQSPSYFSLSYWVYTDLCTNLGYDVANISLANILGTHIYIS